MRAPIRRPRPATPHREIALSTDIPAAPAALTFRDLALNEAVVRALDDVGYESPTPIQAATIPRMLEGADIVGQAQTGTGKTAAFALPILSRIDVQQRAPQALDAGADA